MTGGGLKIENFEFSVVFRTDDRPIDELDEFDEDDDLFTCERTDEIRTHLFAWSCAQWDGETIEVDATSTTLSGTDIQRVIAPRFSGWGDRVRWGMQENFPGRFPYTAGVFPFRRTEEDPTRMFAGEGRPEQTNQRFHYVSADTPAKRLSTAFDSVTLYGQDPDLRPDIYGKVGNSGVSVATLDDAKKLYSGFDLVDSATSVSMTINGPAPMILAFFLNAAIDQQVERYGRLPLIRTGPTKGRLRLPVRGLDGQVAAIKAGQPKSASGGLHRRVPFVGTGFTLSVG